jgi:GrpB-like predicted nucleotidyltransferase (UPF0157 family)
MRTIVVVDYDRNWPDTFERLRADIWPVVCDVALAVEHVGSTAVPGLAAKPIIDLTVVVPTDAQIPAAIDRLAGLGYVHRGNLGVEGREAFDADASRPRHHLYLCPADSVALANHRAVRDYLRRHPEAARQYGELKKRLAKAFPHDIDRYVDGKTGMILEMLRTAGLPAESLAAIARANRCSAKP